MLDSDVESANSVNLATAWTRYWAKQFDLIIYYLVLKFAFGLFPGSVHLVDSVAFAFVDEFPLIAGIFLLPFLIAIDGFLISGPGNSPGRWIAGIKVRDLNGEKLNARGAFKRSWILYMKGFLFGIQLFYFIGFFRGYMEIYRVGYTEWDQRSHSRAYNDGGNIFRTGVLIIITTVCVFLSIHGLI